MFFSGWGFEADAIGFSMPGYDTFCLWDYDSDPARAVDTESLAAPYDEVVVVGWSFGVNPAARFIESTSARVTRTIAINGTPTHIDDLRGIPRRIFEGTLQNLDQATLLKFRRRAIGSTAKTADIATLLEAPSPTRLEQMRLELARFGHHTSETSTRKWSVILIGENDRIFPAQNQLRAWEDQPDVRVLPGGDHLVPAAELRRYIVDKQLVGSRFAKAAATYGTHSPVQRKVSDRLLALLTEIPAVHPPRVVEIGAGTSPIFNNQHHLPHYASLEIWDIAPIDPALFPADARLFQADAEIRIDNIGDNTVDLLVSASTIQWFNSPERFIDRLARRLAPGGIAAFSFYQPGTLAEFADTAGVTLRYPRLDILQACAAENGLKILVAEEDEIPLKFESAAMALRHMQLTGVNAVESGTAARVAVMRYIRCHECAPGQPVTLTYRPAWLVIQKPPQK